MSLSGDPVFVEASDTLEGPNAANVDLLRTQLSLKCNAVTAYLLSSREPVEKRRLVDNTMQDLMDAFNLMATSYLSVSSASQVAYNLKAALLKSVKEEVAAAIKSIVPTLPAIQPGSSYADMTAKRTASKVDSHKVKINNGPTVVVPKTVSVVIGPKTAMDSNFATADDTRKAIIRVVRPGDVNLKVNKVVNTRNKSVRIIAEEMDLPKLKASNALAEAGLEIKEREKLNPRLVIRDVPTDYSDNDLTADICSLNLDASNDSIKIVYRYPSRLKNGLASVVIETTAGVRRQLLDQGRVFLSWRSCKIEDHLRILQCYRCQEFGHLAKNCSASAACGNCAGAHETSSCTVDVSSYKCKNCAASKSPNSDHRAFDALKCPIIKRRLTEKAKNIAY